MARRRSEVPPVPSPPEPAASPSVEARPRRQRRSPEAARQLILDAADRVIAVRGPDAVGLKDVAKEAGVSHALVCHYFGTYDALVTEVVRFHVTKFRNSVIEQIAAPNALKPEEWLEALIDRFAKPAKARVILWAMLSGRLAAADAFPRKEQGLKQLADAVSLRLTAVHGTPPKRERVESVLITSVAAAWGYMFGREILWAATGREANDVLDTEVRKTLVRLIAREMIELTQESEPPPKRRA